MLGALCAPAVLAAADKSESKVDLGWEYSLSTVAVRMPEVDLDGGGRTELESYHFRAGMERYVSETTKLGLGMRYDAHERDFSGGEGFAALEPWDRTYDFGISGSVTQRTRIASFGFRPFVNWWSEDGDLNSDAMTYGAAIAAVAGFSSDRRIGLGVQVSRDIDDSSNLSPIVMVDWRINDHWAIGNPRETSFTAPAGLEVSYRHGKYWRFALAGVYQSSEFRLDHSGVAPGGIGENEGILTFLRITRRWPPGFSVHAYLGATFNGELSVENADGTTLAESDYDTAPLAALSLEGSF